jgi:iron(III) transport system substrate-binding protein
MSFQKKKMLFKRVRAGLLAITLWSGTAHGADSAAAKPDVDAAKKEGTVVVYGTTILEDMARLNKLFNQKFPTIKVDYFRSTGRSLYERILNENRARSYAADIYQISGMQMWMLGQRGLLLRYASRERAAVDEGGKDKEGYWTALYSNTYATAYNTRNVAGQDIPHSYKDLLAPKWKGRMALAEETYEWLGSMIQIMGREKALQLMRELAKQELRMQSKTTLSLQLLCAGEFSLDLANRINLVEGVKEKGCPADWVGIEPLTQRPPVAIAVPKTAPHPTAAKVYTDFMLSQETQQFMSRVLQRESSRVDVDPPIKRLKGMRIWKSDWEQIFRSYDDLVKTYQEVFRTR